MSASPARFTVCLLIASVVTFSAAFSPLHVTGTGNKQHPIASRPLLDVAAAHVSHQSSDNDSAAAASAGTPPSSSYGKEWAADDRSARQRRFAIWKNRKQYGVRQARSGRNVVGVGWNKRPRYYREDGTTRDWRTNMMRVWGKRNGRRASGFARRWALF